MVTLLDSHDTAGGTNRLYYGTHGLEYLSRVSLKKLTVKLKYRLALGAIQNINIRLVRKLGVGWKSCAACADDTRFPYYCF